MGLNNAWSFCLDAVHNRPEAQVRAQQFHAKNNHRLGRHMLAHLCIGGLAVLDQEPMETATQMWLCCAVVPVAIRDRIYPCRSSKSFKNATRDSTLSGGQAL